MRTRIVTAALAAVTLVGCTSAQVSTGLTAFVDGTACAAAEQQISGKTLAQAEALATDPACLATLQALIAAGAPSSATVTVMPATPGPPAATTAPAAVTTAP